jgi:hypothetical protein
MWMLKRMTQQRIMVERGGNGLEEGRLVLSHLSFRMEGREGVPL